MQKFDNPFKGKKHSLESYKLFGHKEEKNQGAKKYIFIDPSQKEYFVHGRFKKFIKENGLSLGMFSLYLNDGKIPPVDPKYNRITEQRIKSTGWEVKYYENYSSK